MPAKPSRQSWAPYAALAIAAVFFAQSFAASLTKSATYDEPAHISAGMSYLATGRIVVGPEHPPLLKELSALALRAAGVRWPISADAAAALNGDRRAAAAAARSLIVDNGPDRVLLWARLPLILVATALVFGVFLLGRRLAGDVAGLAAALLCAFDPNVLAHSYLVTTDAGLATFLVLFIVALWDYVNRPNVWRGVLCGALLGAALAAKYSAIILPPIAAMLMGAAVLWPGNGPSRAKARPVSQADDGWPGRVRRYAIGFAIMCGIAFVVLQFVYLFPANPLQYLAGWQGIYGGHVEDFQGYLAGKLAPRFYSYYVVAFLLKEPIPLVALSVAGLLIVLTDRRISGRARAFFLLPPAVLVAGYTVMSFDIGIRYVIPALPFAHVLGGLAIARAANSVRVPIRAAATALGIWALVSSAGIYPDHLSYFNEAACLMTEPRKVGWDGGSRCGPVWLDDSNVDWGQGLKQLKAWLDRNAPGRHIRLGYFGTVPPEAYGIAYTPMSDEDLLNGGSADLYAVSAHLVASTPAMAKQARGAGAEWLRRTVPVAIVGHAYYIFDRRGLGASR